MWHLMVSFFLISSVALSAATATPYQLRRQAPSADVKFTCPKTLPNSLCCSNDLQSNGAVKDCQESRYVIPNPGSSHGELKDRCTTSQLGNGYDTPVCCNIKVRTFKFENGAPIFLGVNCMDAEHVSVGLEKRDPEQPPSAPFDTSKFTRYSPLDHRREVPATATLPLAHPAHAAKDVHAESAQTPQPLWRRRAAKKAARRSLRKRSAASKSKNSVANTIMNDLNSASSRAIVRGTGNNRARAAASRNQISNKPTTSPKEARQLPGLSSLGGLGSLTKLLGGLGKSGMKQVRQLPGVSSLGGLGSLTKLLGGLGGSSGVKQARQVGGLSSLGGLGSLTKLLGGLGGGNGTGLARRVAMVGNIA
ncbi:hypothetical protein PRZ48_002170 [Zasmidium cellare]|uniref:Hydrophobin n=1 Tax=Zasmidium cellare TaxID=395010 RepID=A0ABR0F410_ZASCE|nr:hypothetical protein PRZ48_002170 [Zasmidium cellare]